MGILKNLMVALILFSSILLPAMNQNPKMTQDPQQKALGEITYSAAYAALHANQYGKPCDKHYAAIRDSLRAGSDMTCRICLTKGTIMGLAYTFRDQRMKELIVTFQKEHSEQVTQGLQPFLGVPALYSIIFECLYQRPQPGVMTSYCKDLLTMPLRTPEMANDVLKKLENFNSVGGNIWDARDAQGNTVLQLAVKQGNLPIVKWMESVPDRNDRLHLYQLAHRYNHAEVTEHYWCLIDNDFRNAVKCSDDTYVLQLVNANVPIWTVFNNTRYSLIMLAEASLEIRDAMFEIVKILFAAGASVNASIGNASAETHLEFAVLKGLKDVVKLLLYLGADYKRPNSKTNKIAWEQTDNAEIKALLKNPQEALNNLTEAEKKEFADIKAEREKRLAGNKIHDATAAREGIK